MSVSAAHAQPQSFLSFLFGTGTAEPAQTWKRVPHPMPRKRKSTLGPFPKTMSWLDLVGLTTGCKDSTDKADLAIARLRFKYERLGDDEAAFRCAVFLVALAVCSRFEQPARRLWTEFGIVLRGEPSVPHLKQALEVYVPWESPVRAACLHTLEFWVGHKPEEAALFESDAWTVWREADGSGFCDLGRQFFTEINRYFCTGALRALGPVEGIEEAVATFAEELSLITRTFSARWFNACAKDRIPEQGSIRWYLRHCLGKLDLELSRELSDWDESARWRKSLRQFSFDLAS